MSDQSQFHLLTEQRFGPFFVTQFLGAFNDNFYKNSMMILLAFQGASITTMSSNLVIQLSGALFILPFFLFSATAGQIADKYDKARITRWVKVFEIFVMCLGGLGFYWQNLYLLLVALFFMGMHSAVFGPVKYAILPQHLKSEEIVGGNGLVEMGTNVAILLGTVLSGLLIGINHGPLFVACIAVFIAISGYLSSRKIPQACASSPQLKINWNIFSETWRNLQFTRKNRTVFLSILGISWFWWFGLVFLSQFPNLTKEILHGNETVVSLLLTIFSIGIAGGSLLCERLSGHKVEIGLVPFGSIGLTVFGIDFYFASTHILPHAITGAWEFLINPLHIRLIADLFLIGLFGGFYIVPLYALIQIRSDSEHRSRIIAGNNILNALAMVMSVIMVVGLFKLGLTIPQVLLATALLNAIVAIYIFTLVPEFLMRFLVWIFIHTVYRLKKEGIEKIPDEGAAILLANHVSPVDALIIAAASARPIRFVIDHRIYKIPVLNFIFRTAKAIPITSYKSGSGNLAQAYDAIAVALANGNLICVFPEAGLTQDEEVLQFAAFVQKIIDRTPVPLLPVILHRTSDSDLTIKDPSGSHPIQKRLFSKMTLHVKHMVAVNELHADTLAQKILALQQNAKYDV